MSNIAPILFAYTGHHSLTRTTQKPQLITAEEVATYNITKRWGITLRLVDGANVIVHVGHQEAGWTGHTDAKHGAAFVSAVIARMVECHATPTDHLF